MLFVALQLCSPFRLEKDHDMLDSLMRKENFETHQWLFYYMQINLDTLCPSNISVHDWCNLLEQDL